MTIAGAVTDKQIVQLAKEVEEAPLIISGVLSTGDEFHWNATRGMWHVLDRSTGHRGYGVTILDAMTAIQNDRKHGFIPFSEWVGNELVRL